MKKTKPSLAVLIVGLLIVLGRHVLTDRTAQEGSVGQAWNNEQSDTQVEGSGTVIRLLPDDNDGSRHQRFILKLPSGQTVLMAHNIDLAPRIPALAAGDRVEFCGEYEWNRKGGVIHWTHRDPAGRHPGGWLKHRDKTYQ